MHGHAIPCVAVSWLLLLVDHARNILIYGKQAVPVYSSTSSRHSHRSMRSALLGLCASVTGCTLLPSCISTHLPFSVCIRHFATLLQGPDGVPLAPSIQHFAIAPRLSNRVANQRHPACSLLPSVVNVNRQMLSISTTLALCSFCSRLLLAVALALVGPAYGCRAYVSIST
jgi:hypothetical protein